MVLGGKGEKLPPVGTGIGRHAAQRPFLEKVALVVERWDVGEVDAGDRQGAAPVQGFECDWYQVADGCEEDRRVERLGRLRVRVADRRGAEVKRQLAGG